jgi:hypothetical protein
MVHRGAGNIGRHRDGAAGCLEMICFCITTRARPTSGAGAELGARHVWGFIREQILKFPR